MENGKRLIDANDMRDDWLKTVKTNMFMILTPSWIV